MALYRFPTPAQFHLRPLLEACAKLDQAPAAAFFDEKHKDHTACRKILKQIETQKNKVDAEIDAVECLKIFKSGAHCSESVVSCITYLMDSLKAAEIMKAQANKIMVTASVLELYFAKINKGSSYESYVQSAFPKVKLLTSRLGLSEVDFDEQLATAWKDVAAVAAAEKPVTVTTKAKGKAKEAKAEPKKKAKHGKEAHDEDMDLEEADPNDSNSKKRKRRASA